MFVSRCVENHVWMMIGQDRSHSLAITDIGHQRNSRQVRKLLRQFAIDIKQREFGAFHQKQILRSKSRYLPAQLRSNGAAGPGYHYCLADQELFDFLFIELDLLSSEQVLDLNVAYAAYLYLAL